MKKLLNSEWLLVIVGAFFMIIGVWSIYAGYESSPVDRLKEFSGLADLFRYGYLFFIILIFSLLLLWRSKVATVLIIILALIHLPFGWQRMLDGCYAEVEYEKGPKGIIFFSNKKDICVSFQEEDRYRIFREYKKKNLKIDAGSFERIEYSDNMYRDKNCTLYEYNSDKNELKCVGNTNCFYKVDDNDELTCINNEIDKSQEYLWRK